MLRITTGRGRELPCFAILFLLWLAVGEARANPDVYQRALRSTGWLLVPKDAKECALGTCWLVDRERKLAITCHHVVGDAREALVYFPCIKKGEVVAEAGHYLRNVPATFGRVIASDEARDLALIQLESVPSCVEPLPLAAHSARPGEIVHSIGNPDLNGGFGDGTLWWYTRGTVRQIRPLRVETPDGIQRVRMVESQSPVNQGDSGGPVVNDKGELVGVARSYKAAQRLVSESVDVMEVKDFLKNAPGPGKEVREPAHLVGDWQFAPDVEDRKGSGRAEFKEDGTFVLAPTDKKPAARQGRYAYANGVLWLMSETGYACVSLTWSGKDHFTFSSTKPQLVFHRQEPAE
jgi:S1-C subfamily serine protease